MMQEFVSWLEQTRASLFLADTTSFATWLIIPVSQCIHIISISVLMISVGTLNLRLLGIGSRRQTFAQAANFLMPWIWGALFVLFLTGTLQTIAEPGRELLNIGFKVKMALLFSAVVVTLFYQRSLKSDLFYWEATRRRECLGRALAAVSLMLWIGVAVSGRLIAYLDMRRDF